MVVLGEGEGKATDSRTTEEMENCSHVSTPRRG
jgi:hypothetical protein